MKTTSCTHARATHNPDTLKQVACVLKNDHAQSTHHHVNDTWHCYKLSVEVKWINSKLK